MKFQSKPKVIEAIQFTGQESLALMIHEWKEPFRAAYFYNGTKLEIYTLEGVMLVPMNNWVIRGVNGEFYSCDPEIFEKSYEAVT